MKYMISLMAVILAIYYYRLVSKYNGRVVKLIYFELIYNLIIKFLIGNIGLPSTLNYVADFVLIWIIAEFLYGKRKYNYYIPKSLVLCGTFLWVASIVSYIGNLYSPLLYLWGVRNNFRFILFAMMCAVYLRERDIQMVLRILTGFFYLNIIVVTYQYFFVSYSQSAIGDFISGLFSNGMERGGNASLDWLMCIVCTYAIVGYLNKTGSLMNVIITIVGSVYMAALGEIKLFYIQLVIIGILAITICKKSFKVLGFVIAGSVGLYIGIQFLYFAFPKFADFFTYETLISYVTKSEGYSSRGHSMGIDRLTIFSYVFSQFLQTLPQRLCGIGLGNADFSSFSILTSSFYKNYSWSGYTFFSSSFVLIEMGIMGLIAYLVYFANYIWHSFKAYIQSHKLNNIEKNVYCATIILGLICFLMIFSNQTLKMETSAYMVNAMLAMSFVVSKDIGLNEKNRYFNTKN